MMNSKTKKTMEMNALAHMSEQTSYIHQIHPTTKILVTLAFIVVVISYDRYALDRLLPLTSYLMFVMIVGDIPIQPLLKRLLPASIFVIGVGLFNPILDRQLLWTVYGIPISGGWMSFITLTAKGLMTVLATLLLLTTTTMEDISMALKQLKVPPIFIMQFMMTFRYISVLIEEITKTHNAYVLRAPKQKGISLHVWGSLAGQLLMRTFDRSKNIHEAMVMRGFNGSYHFKSIKRHTKWDITYGVLWIGIFIVIRLGILPQIIEGFVNGGAL